MSQINLHEIIRQQQEQLAAMQVQIQALLAAQGGAGAGGAITGSNCYELRSLGLDNRTTLVLSNLRELDRVPSTK